MSCMYYCRQSLGSAADVAPVEDESEHLLFYPFRPVGTGDYYENDEAIDAIFQAVQDGLLTPDEATDLVLGKLL